MSVAGKAMAEPVWTTYYGGTDGYCGLVTASAEVYDCGGYTAASPYLPLGSLVEVCYDGCVTVRVNDRCACGLDLSVAAADAIGLPGSAVAEVTVL